MKKNPKRKTAKARRPRQARRSRPFPRTLHDLIDKELTKYLRATLGFTTILTRSYPKIEPRRAPGPIVSFAALDDMGARIATQVLESPVRLHAGDELRLLWIIRAEADR